MRKFAIKLLGVFLSVFIFTLLLSFYGKTIFTGFMTDLLGNINTTIEDKQFAKDNNHDDTTVTISKNYTVSDILNSPKYKDFLKNREVQKLVQKYVDTTISGVTDTDSLNDIDLGEDIVVFIEENRTLLEKEFDITITDEDIKNLKDSEDFKEITDRYIENVQIASDGLTSGQKKLIKVFNFICSTTFKIILILLIFIDLILIAVLERPFYRVIKSLGVNLITSGLLTVVLGLILNFSITSMVSKMSLKIHFNFLDISIIGGVATCIGIIILIMYFMVKKVVDKNSMEELYEQVSHGKEEMFQSDNEFSSDDE